MSLPIFGDKSVGAGGLWLSHTCPSQCSRVLKFFHNEKKKLSPKEFEPWSPALENTLLSTTPSGYFWKMSLKIITYFFIL